MCSFAVPEKPLLQNIKKLEGEKFGEKVFFRKMSHNAEKN